jgi:hypothetical protein
MTNQELLDRYIYAVKILLPLNKRDDIAAEIKSNLLALIEDEEALLGHTLEAPELEAILQQQGHPVAVASRYGTPPMRRLIGPVLFPFYWFALRAALLLVVATNIIIAVVMFTKSPHPGAVLLHLWRNLWLGGISAVGWITIVFAAMEHFQVKFRYLAKWNPRSLPAIPHRKAQPPPIVQIVVGTVLLVLWAITLYSPRLMLLGRASVFNVSPPWYAMRVPLLLLAVFGIARACLKLTRFASAEWLPLVRIGINISGLAFIIFFLRAGDLLVPGTNWNPSRDGASLAIVNQIVSWSLVGASVLSALMCLHELRRYVRRRRNPNMIAV